MNRLIYLAIFLFTVLSTFAQEERRILVTQTHVLLDKYLLDSVEINIAFPKDYKGRQEINNISYSVKPKYIFNKDGMSFAHFSFNKKSIRRVDTISIEIDMTLFHYDLTVAKKDPSIEKLSKRKRKQYLKNTGLYELPEVKNPEVFQESARVFQPPRRC